MVKYILVAILFASCSSSTNVRTKSVPYTTASENASAPENSGKPDGATSSNKSSSSIYQFKVESLEGGEIDFSKYRGKKILVVNTASKCGYTPQYKELEDLYKQYQSKLVVVGFPANNFGAQEPGTNEEIKEFCQKNYGVSFPMAAKVSVKGDDIAPVYKWLTSKSMNGVLDAEIKWNFNKFLLDENGKMLAKFESKSTPLSQEIVTYLK